MASTGSERKRSHTPLYVWVFSLPCTMNNSAASSFSEEDAEARDCSQKTISNYIHVPGKTGGSLFGHLRYTDSNLLHNPNEGRFYLQPYF